MADESSTIALRKNRIEFLVFSVGFCVCFSTYSAILNLQSSTGIEGGIGQITLYSTQTSAFLSALTIDPILLRKLGPKTSMLVGELGYAMFVISNAFIDLRKEVYFVVIVSVLCGIGISLMWPATAILNVYYGKQHAQHMNKPASFYCTKYIAAFFGIFQFNQILGNIVTFLIIKLIPNNEDNDANITNNNTTWDYGICGAADCQDPNITGKYLSRYTINNIAMYSMTGIFCVINIVVVIIQYFVLSNPTDTDNRQQVVTVSKIVHDNYGFNDYNENIMTYKAEEIVETMKQPNLPQLPDIQIVQASQQGDNHTILGTLTSTLGHLSEPLQLLLVPITIYDGLVMGFVWGELTRAGASCILGVSQVGVCMMAYGAGDILLSFFIGKTPSSGLLRNVPFALATVLDCTCYVTLLTWEITSDNSFIIYFLFFGFGCGDGIWQTLLNVRHGEYFPEKQGIAFNCWSYMIILGALISYLWSKTFCVYVKIYINLGYIGFALFFYGLAEVMFNRKKRREFETVEIGNAGRAA